VTGLLDLATSMTLNDLDMQMETKTNAV